MSPANFTIIAHRGFSSQAPENTIAAFDLALKNDFTNIELDVQLTRNDFDVLHTSLTEDMDYLLTLSRLKRER